MKGQRRAKAGASALPQQNSSRRFAHRIWSRNHGPGARHGRQPETYRELDPRALPKNLEDLVKLLDSIDRKSPATKDADASADLRRDLTGL